jgi:two-component system phosphate regulon sensor histidine kinase PhoR
MWQRKNLTPQALAVITALAISVPFAMAIWLIEEKGLYALFAIVLAFCFCYFIILSVIENFINRKIKLIYKFINQTKASKREEIYYKFILPPKHLDEVTEDVEAWAEQYNKEIDLLQKNETFRKEFLQNLSHEFKTPVFAIQGYVDTLLQGALENPDVNRKFLEKASRNVERLVNLIRDLDEISKLERGELRLHKDYFIIQDLVKEVFEALSWKADQKNITFSIKKGCEQPLVVYADKEKLRQVVGNLIDNSIKYGKTTGSVIASMYKTDDNHILVEISDDGIGIPEKQINRIFERFFRTSEGRARDIAGSGLGLAICKHIIEAHDQNIHVRSKEGVGTTIGFTLDTKKKEKHLEPAY